MKLHIVIPVLNDKAALSALLTSIKPSGAPIVVSDGISSDGSLEVAIGNGVRLIVGCPGRGTQLRRGARAANAGDRDWYLFLHADSQLPPGWLDICRAHMTIHSGAAYFRFKIANTGAPRMQVFLFELGVMLRNLIFALPYGDQGLLISKTLYDEVGGYIGQPLFEDVAIVRSIKTKKGRRALRRLPAALLTNPARHLRDGFWRRSWRNIMLLHAYYRDVPMADLVRRYQ